MSLDLNNIREVIRPQDGVAMAITVMGLAIALFLDDSIVKLIGVSIAVLGGVAFYMTIRQRVNDRIQLKTRKTTLPPPAFKTRVTEDPTTSTKRIRFDDFQDAFGPDTSDNAQAQETPAPIAPTGPTQPYTAAVPGESFSIISGAAAASATAQQKATLPEPVYTVQVATGPASKPALSFQDDILDDDMDDEQGIPPAGRSGEYDGSFRVVRPGSDVKKNDPPPAQKTAPAQKTMLAQQAAPPVQQPPAQPAPQPSAPQPIAEPAAAVTAEAQATDDLNRRQVRIVLDELIPDGVDEGRVSEPRAEFVRLVAQVLNAIARSIEARSIVFFWVNMERRYMIPEAKVTNGSGEIKIGAKLPIGSDIVSQIARSGVPEIITNISPAAERDLITYYARAAGTHSFVGVPVIFRREVVGVLAADSAEESGFDEGSVATLAEYTRLISGLIRGYTEKFDLHLIAHTLDAFEEVHSALTGAALQPAEIGAILADQMAQLFDSLYVAVVLFDGDEREWGVAACASETMRDEILRLVPDMEKGLVGQATRYAEEIYHPNFTDQVRFAPQERFKAGGSFLALPLVASTKCYGALVMEHPSPNAYIERDIELIRDLVRYASMAIEVVNTNQAIEAQVVFDEATGLYNTSFLIATLEREILRARDFKTPLSFVLVGVDFPESFRKGGTDMELEEYTIAGIGNTITNILRSYDTVGCYNYNTFGVVLVGRNDQEAYLWSEKLRKEVAARILTHGKRKYSVTVSVGVSDVHNLEETDTVVDGSLQALEKARSEGGNAVIIY